MPPPSCTGMLTAARIASTAARVHRPAGEGAVEIDDVQPFEALRLEGVRLRGGIVVEHGRLRHVALAEPHAVAVLEVDGREQDHGRHLEEIGDQSARPSVWLFSGWNCVPAMLSRATMAVTGAAVVGSATSVGRARARPRW